ncbi:MAG: sigma-70 family RNA polymerase sigma factor [Polyangiaceae bacterium]
MDHDLYLPAISSGDPAAFGRWVAGSELRIRASLERYSTQVDTEAVLQETLLRIWQVAPRFRPDGKPDALLRFAIRVGRNLAVSEVRRRREVATEVEDPGEPVAPLEPDPMLRDTLVRCREELPKKPRLALEARLTGGSDRELAAQVAMQPNTFLQNVTRARKLLVACLERHGVALAAVMR